METKQLRQLLETFCKSFTQGDSIDINVDSDTEATVTISECAWVKNPNYRGYGPGQMRPVGEVVFTMKITASYVPDEV